MSNSGAIRIRVAGIGGLRILLDECVPWPMHRFLEGHDCRTAQQCGWGGVSNGRLLELAESEFDLFITSDQNLRYQQNLLGRRLSILQISTNKLRPIRSSAGLIQSVIEGIKPGEFRTPAIP